CWWCTDVAPSIRPPADPAEAPGDEVRSPIEGVQARLDALRARCEELEALNRNYMDMLGFVAHELKSPLASAVMNLYMIKDAFLGPVNPAQDHALDIACQSLAYIEDMIRNYLDLSRLEKAEMHVVKTYFPLQTRIVGPVLDGMAQALERQRMAVEDHIPGGKVVYADANLLRIVYENLLSNAVKYGRDGSAILLEAEEREDNVALSVQNEGPGIPAEEVSRLFQRFSRLYHPEHAARRGTGLGLYICKEIVEKHGGEISVQSEPGRWVRFRFTLPTGPDKRPEA
ncbi:MAG: HAMP domain-containing sensor histidine kinase, partial [Anaerolineae bacterium]